MWLNLFHEFNLHNFSIFGSDHNPICFTLYKPLMRRKWSFKFGAMWLQHPEFQEMVKRARVCEFDGSPNDQFRTCAVTFKHIVSAWNKQVFGNITLKIRDL